MAKKRFYTNYEMNADYDNKAGSILPSGKGSLAGMPQSVVMKEWSATRSSMSESLNDSSSGIDSQISKDIAGIKFAPKKV